MASNAELVNLTEEDKKKMMAQRRMHENKWSINVVGVEIPYWAIALVIILILYVLHRKGMLTGVEKKIVELSDGARRRIDTLLQSRGKANVFTTSTTSSMIPTLNTPPSMGTTSVASVTSGPATEEVKKQLRNLFNSF
jgi:cytoskeletal protein RodZ